MNSELAKSISTPSLYLAAFALLGAIVLSGAYYLTLPKIQENERQATLSRLNALVKPGSYDNDLLADKVELPAADFHSGKDVTVYRARAHGQPVAALFKVTAPDGYSGNIEMVVGIRADQTLAGVRILNHKETPGLGDKIETEKSNWILGFTDKSLKNPGPEGWAVRKDNGQFDQFTGATITPRAVVNEVKATLQWSQQHFNELFAMPASKTTETK